MVMASAGNQQTWMPFASTKDCSQGFCSLYCPQWCYIIFPPPPPFDPPSEDSGINFSPLVIAIIGILASAFVLVSYYTIVSKYCRNVDSLRRIHRHRNEEYDDGGSPSQHDPWQTGTSGLDEALIKSIAVCKYKRGDGLIDGTDCSVCLSEFQDNERLRLLPKCSHAFHVQCIDTWLNSHSNCPLCRADIMPTTSPSPLQLPPPVHESLPDHGTLTEGQQENHTIAEAEDSQRVPEEHLTVVELVPKSPFRTLSDLGSIERDTIIEIRDEEIQSVRRSLSMDSSCQGRVSIADVLGMTIEDNIQESDRQSPMGVVPPKQWEGEHSKRRINKNKVLHSVMSPIAMKRSPSNGRFFLTRNGRGRNASVSILN